MDEELYNAILSGMDPTRSQAMAKRLRNKDVLGQMQGLSFDPQVAGSGVAASKQAMDTATGLGESRQNEEWRKTQEAMTRDAQAQRKHEFTLGQEQETRENVLQRALQRELAQMSLYGRLMDGGGEGKKLTYSNTNKLEKQGAALAGLDTALANFDPSYAQQLGSGPQSKLPAAMAAMGLPVGQKAEDAAQWLADFKSQFTLETRNQMFGATLTDSEQKAWEEAQLINLGMNPKEIQRRLTRLQTVAGERLQRTTRGLAAEGYNPEAIQEYVGRPLSLPGGPPSGAGGVTVEVGMKGPQGNKFWETYGGG